MKRRFKLLFLGFMLLMLFLPFQAAAAGGSELLLNRFNGTIFDFDQTRILWKEPGGQVLWLYNRAVGSQVKVYDAAGSDYVVRNAKLSAEGVVYSVFSAINGSHQYWKNGEVRLIGAGQKLYKVKGNFALFTNGVVDLTTGQFQCGCEYETDMLADGTVIFTTRDSLYKMLPDRTYSVLFSRPYGSPPWWYRQELGYYGPLTDGNSIIYRELMITNHYRDLKWVLRVRSADNKVTTLALNPWPETGSYEINNGWIAYTEYNKDKDRWILYVRSPEGVEKQVFESPLWWSEVRWKSVFFAPLYIDQLGPDGTVAYRFNDRTYLYSTQAGKLLQTASGPGAFQYREHVFNSPGASQYRYGTWYRLTDNSLFSIRT